MSLASVYASNLKIVEVFPNTTDDKNLEYIKLHNFSQEEINLAGFQVSDLKKSYIFPEDTVIKAGSGFILSRPISKLILNNSDESLSLKDLSGSIVDEVGYETSEKGVILYFHEELFAGDGDLSQDLYEESPDDTQEDTVSEDSSQALQSSGEELSDQNNIEVEADSKDAGESQEGVSNIQTENSENSSSEDETRSSVQEDFSILYNLQQPSYISFVQTLTGGIDEYVCDASRDICKVNFDFTPSFSESFKESQHVCKLSFGFSGAEDQAEKCNPNTIEIPEGEHDILIEVFQKDSGVKVSQKLIRIVYSQEEGPAESSSDDMQEVSSIFIYRPEIIVQSGLDGSGRYFYCQKENCKINLKYEPRHKLERCWWRFYPGEYSSDSTREKCNPGYVTFPPGVHELYLEVYQKDRKSNKSRLRFYIYNDGTRYEDTLPVAARAWKKGFGPEDIAVESPVIDSVDTSEKSASSGGILGVDDGGEDLLQDPKVGADKGQGKIGEIVFQGGETKSKSFSGGTLYCIGVEKCYVNLDYSGELGVDEVMHWYVGDKFLSSRENPKGIWLDSSQRIYAELLLEGVVKKSFESSVVISSEIRAASSSQNLVSSKKTTKPKSSSSLATFNIFALKYDGLRFSGKAPSGSEIQVLKGAEVVIEGISNEKGRYRLVMKDFELGTHTYSLEVRSAGGSLISRLEKSYLIDGQVAQYWNTASSATNQTQESLSQDYPGESTPPSRSVVLNTEDSKQKYFVTIAIFILIALGVLHLVHELNKLIPLFHVHPVLHSYQTNIRYKVILLL